MLNSDWENLAVQACYRPRLLAALCKVSPRTVQRHFKVRYRMTVGAWLSKLRLRHAYDRITAGELVKAVAYDLGFKQLSHFSRAFKQVHGVPPSLLTSRSRLKLNDYFCLSQPRADRLTVGVREVGQEMDQEKPEHHFQGAA